ncbi:hypothetical protein [Ferrovibrio terrae]|uniref:hypothetical protein n=1 Tax=Ferrovibrio terrae TaxID=2594003 RepID=UPI003137F398
MATYAKELLSASTDGRNIKVVATATAGTLIHTADATAMDEVFLFANNRDSVARLLTIEFGGVTSPDDLVVVTLAARSGPRLIVPGWVLTGGLLVRAFAEAANVIGINGYVNRIS